jgi:hypothetical protein
MKKCLLVLLLAAGLQIYAQDPIVNSLALPRALPGQPYSFQLSGTCYNPPCTWIASSALPHGFSLSATGLITGQYAGAFLPTLFSLNYVDQKNRSGRASFALGNAPNRTMQWPHSVKSAAIPYLWSITTTEWLRQNFDILFNGNPDLSSSSDIYPANVIYTNGAGWYPNGTTLKFVVDVATARGWANYEDVFLHAIADYATPNGPTWHGMDQFDIWDKDPDYLNGGGVNPRAVRNGVLLYHNGSFSDVSVGIYMQKGPYTIANGDQLFIGYTEPFDLMNFNLAVGRADGAVSWSYWNGSAWVDLTIDQGDSTAGLSSSGTVQFTPPATWQQTSVNNSHAKWWVRLSIDGASTSPQIAQLAGDNWLSASATCNPNACNARGWNATDPHRVNIGLGNLEYNPTPPPNATARFRYQARGTGYSAANYLTGNPNSVDPKTGDVMMAQAKAAESEAAVTYYSTMGQYGNGDFFDNIGGRNYWTSDNSDLPPGKTIDDGFPQMFQQMAPLIQAAFGNDFTISANLNCLGTCLAGVLAQTSMSLQERTAVSTIFGHYYYATNYMDPFAVGTYKRVLGFFDTYHFQALYDPCAFNTPYHCPSYHYWAQNDLSPMHTLAGYLMGMNNNTVFEYNTQGWYYGLTDEVFVMNTASTTLAEPVVTDIDDTPQSIHVVDGSSFQDTHSLRYVLKIGNDWITATPGSDINHYNLNTGYGTVYLTQDYPIGTTVQSAVVKHIMKNGMPAYNNVFLWGTWFPAMKADFGQPDANGFNGGNRGVWYTGAQIGGSADCGNGNCPPLERRDFTKALVLQRAMADYEPNEWETPSKVIQLPSCPGCQWRRLHADLTLDPASTTVTLTGQESAIFMKAAN